MSLPADKPNGRRAVTILSGFLGSGKTTLLRRYLRECTAAEVAVLINEYGAVGVDHHLLRMVEERAVLLQGGCVCCTRRADLVTELRDLLDLDQSGSRKAWHSPLGQVVIETSGLADPVPILFTLATDPVLRHHFDAPSVIVTLDAVTATDQIARHPEVRKQIVAADHVVITKPDLAAPGQVEACRRQAMQFNPTAEITVSCLGEGYAALAPSGRRRASPKDFALTEQPHPEVRSIALTFSDPLGWPAFSVWLSMLLHARGPDVLRIKGLLDIGDAGPVLLNVAQHVVHPPEHLATWPPGEARSYLVFITREIDPERIAVSLQSFQRAGGRAGLRVTPIA